MNTYKSRCDDLEREIADLRSSSSDLETCVKSLTNERDGLLSKNKELADRIELLERRAESWKRLAGTSGRGDYTDAALDAFVRDRG